MRPFAALLLLVLTAYTHAQQPLSFEPGGRKACSAAIGMDIPAPTELSRSFDYACDEHDLAIEKTRFDALARSMESAPADQRVAFNALMVSFAAFRDTHVATEVCASGTGCGEMQESEKAHNNAEFLHLFDGPATLPAGSADEADAALNETYQKILARLPTACAPAMDDCQSQAMLRDTQRDWIRFRDAWITFATLRFPATPPGAWLTLLTLRRTKQLSDGFTP